MSGWIVRTLAFLVVALTGITAKAAANEHKEKPQTDVEDATLNLMPFRVGLNAAIQSTTEYSLGPAVSWNPTYRILPAVDLVGILEVDEFSTDLGTYFSIVQMGALASFPLAQSIGVEAGLSAAYWSGDGGNVVVPSINANGFYKLNTRFLGKIVVGYNAMIVPKMLTHILHIGVETK